MKYKVEDKICIAGIKYKIISTKDVPYRPTIDVYNRKERYPEKDYLVFRFITANKEEKLEHYSGIEDVYENQIDESMFWDCN